MRYLFLLLFIVLSVLIFGFGKKVTDKTTSDNDGVTNNLPVETATNTTPANSDSALTLGFVGYAKTFIGTPYLYGSKDPAKGLDCSGFINVVSDHFDINVPRSSVEFTNIGTTIETDNARPGDLILFTGTDPGRRVVGHIGIITENVNGDIQFIHSSSGKANGVTLSDLEGYYETRFVKVIRILPTDTSPAIV
jgi:cell wall-associated NlpC family hydrolase